MTDHPIIFSGPMVRALLAGRKTMTRRLAWRPARKGEKAGEGSRLAYVPNEETGVGVVTGHFRPSSWRGVKAGDRLWVRESLKHITSDPVTADPTSVHCYAADIPHGMTSANPYEESYLFAGDGEPNLKPHSVPSIHMPRWASRLTLEVTGVKMERLQDMSEEDALAEGVHRIGHDMPWATSSFNDGPNFYTIDMGGGSLNQPTAAGTFALLWKILHGEESWDQNPEVIAISFRVVKANIDALEALAA